MTRERTMGTALGLAAALLVISCLTISLNLLIVFISPVLLIPLVVGVRSGIRLAKAGILPRLSWPGIILVSIFSVGLSPVAPYALSVAELRWHGLEIPVPPGASILETRTGPMGSSMAGPSVTQLIHAETTEDEVKAFLREELRRGGWEEFQLTEDRGWFTRPGRRMLIEFDEAETPARFRATYNLDHITAPWLILLTALGSALFIRVRYREHLARAKH